MIAQTLNQCRWCKNTSLTKYFESKPLPTNIWPIADFTKRRFEKASIFLCNSCGHIQLQDMEYDFVASLYEGYDFIIDNHETKKDRANLILKYFNTNKSIRPTILDIGGGVNSIHNYLNRENYFAEAIDFAISQETKDICHKTYLGDVTEFDFDRKFDYIVSYHCLEHFNKTREAFQKIFDLLDDDGYFIFEVPDNEEVLKINHPYMIFHQHLNLYNENFLTVAVQEIGFKILEIIKSGSAISYVLKKGKLDAVLPMKFNINESQKIIEKFLLKLNETNAKIDSLLLTLKDKKIGFYGAGGSTALFLANYDRLGSFISEIFDRDLKKHGKFILNSNLIVKKPDEINETGLDYLLFIQHDVFNSVRKNITNINCIDLSNLLSENI